ncbi:glutathione S-transferase family protein [Phyllobacterium zundukense]|uniref:Glutathione S-transferase family protein n=1 Tax=Phyllobacterium zundukense TaxID=1867719 RepID=A0ACD4D409_9HYPH|nr:glutathione S-transferase family protein [Phyllobacterium zundukense]UXN60608.1 glutathione S-transferase family protein [Phyllobacterium zundukense]
MEVKLYGTEESVYTRIVRLVLLAKKVEFALIEADPFEGGILPEDYDLRHPFKRIPALEMDGVRLYETDVIVHYIDAVIEHPRLVPSRAEDSARMRQIMRIVDNYAYRPLVWGLYVPVYWREGLDPADEDIEKSRHVLGVLEGFVNSSPEAGLNDRTLATCYLASVLAAADSVAPGSRLIDERPRLRGWWNHIKTEPIMVKTRSKHTKF